MAVTAFGLCLLFSVLLLAWTASKRYENVDRYYWTVAVLIPVIILGYWLKTIVVSEEAALITFCFIYLDSTILLTVIVFMMLRTIGVEAPGWVRLGAYGAAFLHLLVVWNCVHNDLYFDSVQVIPSAMGSITKISGGPLKIYHFIYLGIMLSVILGILAAGFVRSGTYSRRSLMFYAVIVLAGIAVYGVERLTDLDFSPLPILYVIADLIFTLSYDRIFMHEISYIIAGHEKEHGKRGFVAFDTKRRFLSCNALSARFWPELQSQRVDELLPEGSPLRKVFYTMIDAYLKRGEKSARYQIGDMTCICEITAFTLTKNGETEGYLFDIRDATEEQRTMDIVTSYNEKLNAEVAAKTRDILEMQDKIVAGMANMIENRDNNTGGHVKRTSDIIRILVDEIRREGLYGIDETKAADIIRAAPMHDLGKLSIENSILNKPGRLTEEEYSIMKTHAEKSGEIVMILLKGVEEDHFVETAYRVARYHHERWDGRGYPEQLVGSMIPVEARIMAVADVYDALVSPRSYKASMDPGMAARIMQEGMGTQFDPALFPVFAACRDRLEAYYRQPA